MILFVTGIDTGIGKTVATGLLAAWFARQGRTVITQKLVQTGCQGTSEDILEHRRIMGVGLTPQDELRLTCPASYSFPASPHLAAQLAGQRVDRKKLVDATHQLAATYDIVLVEGAGGLFVPLTRSFMTIDLLAEQAWPVALVTTPRLGSINHTLLSLEALGTRGIMLSAILYNLHFTAAPEIIKDTREMIGDAVATMGSTAPVIDLPAGSLDCSGKTWNDERLPLLLQPPRPGVPGDLLE